MLKIVQSNRFKKDIKKLKKQGKTLSKLDNVVTLLVMSKSLPLSYKDHSLIGNWKGHRELHIEPDWLLIYKIIENELLLARTGSHSELLK